MGIHAALDRRFKISEHGSSVKTECLAGLTTFLTMAYIAVVNPSVLSAAGMDFQAVFVATCLTATVGCFLMGLMANYPIAIAPGMGLNAYFTYSVVQGMGIDWRVALGAVFISSLLFLLVSITYIRRQIIMAMPRSLKFSISAGIGLFLAMIALKSSGIIVAHPATMLALGDIHKPSVLLALLGFLVIVALEYHRVYGGIILGIILISTLSILLGLHEFKGVFAPIPSLAPTFMQLDLSGAWSAGILGVVFVFFFVDLCDTTGTLVGVTHRAGLLKPSGDLERVREANIADSLAIGTGAILGTSSATAYVESTAGVATGGRTGLVAVVVGVLFLLCLWFSPLAQSVPAYATAPALLYVAILMLHGLQEIQWNDLQEAVPAALTLFGIPFTFSIANGIALGFISHVTIKLLTGRWPELSWPVCLIASLFLVKLAFFS